MKPSPVPSAPGQASAAWADALTALQLLACEPHRLGGIWLRAPHGPVREAIDALLVVKRASAEVNAGPRIAAISDFIDRELATRAEQAPRLPAGQGDSAWLDVLFRRMLAEHAPS